jgi:arylsulfatase A-like enzyme
MSRHKINDFATNFSKTEWEKTYPVMLRKSGYYTGFIGKFGVGNPKSQPKEAFDFWAGSDKPQPDYEMKDEMGNFIHHNDRVDQDIKAFLENTNSEKPFCLSVSFKAPHIQDGDPRQFIAQKRFMNLYAKDSIPEPEKADPKYWNSQPEFFRTDKNIARERWYLQFANNKMYQESVRNYFRLITGVDEVVGNLLNALKKKGLDDNTVIIFTSDNGHYLGEYGLTGKWFGHEESVRVPLIIYDPRNKNLQNKTASQFALNIDIAPTILKLAGLQPDTKMQGIDLVEMLNKNKPSRTEFFYEHTFLGSPQLPKVEGLISKDKKYMLYTEHNYEEMYDLKSDPNEKLNIAGNNKHFTHLEQMRRKYKFWKNNVL